MVVEMAACNQRASIEEPQGFPGRDFVFALTRRSKIYCSGLVDRDGGKCGRAVSSCDLLVILGAASVLIWAQGLVEDLSWVLAAC